MNDSKPLAEAGEASNKPSKAPKGAKSAQPKGKSKPKPASASASASKKSASSGASQAAKTAPSGSIPPLRSSLRLPRLRPASACNGSAPSILPGRSTASSPSGHAGSSARKAAAHKDKEKAIPIFVPDFPRPRQRLHSESSTNSTPNALSYNSGVFAAFRSPRRREYVIDPEWASEAIYGGEDWLPPLRHPFCPETPRPSGGADAGRTLWPKRCKSAPPPVHRNPITWE